MKLFIQIPCLNEEATLPQTIADLPKRIDGIDEIEIMVVDDGSTDRTVEVARENGVRHVVSHGTNRGLAAAFSSGRDYALAHGADILVNTDADNQYCGADIAKLVVPILENRAEIVVGCRPILEHKEFSPVKKALQLCGSWALRRISKTTVRDAPSGFRAFSRDALQRIFLHSRFSYCMETLIQAGTTGLRVASVDIRVNPKTRDSRLFKSIPQYLRKTGGTMLHMFVLYRPGTFFSLLSAPFLLFAAALGMRFLVLTYAFPDPARTHVPSLVLLSISAFAGFLCLLLAVLGSLLAANRRLSEETVYLMRAGR
ncbi:MAG: glycosyltransferase family 2 protein [Kiritimatiellae bacterium]|nr:glycosyltransferase family 2 protein [Kiritimatiellia bacterium]